MARAHFALFYDTHRRPAVFTPWSAIHFRSGILLYLLFRILNLPIGANFAATMVVHTIYEFKDFFIKKYTMANSIGDTISCALGFGFGVLFLHAFDRTKTLFVFLGLLTLMSTLTFELTNLG